MLPFDFTIEGSPLSHQTRDRGQLHRWRLAVRMAAHRLWDGSPPLDQPVRLVVAHFHDGPTSRLDNDNMVKPIQDALIGLVYTDDRLVAQVEARQADINGSFYVRGMSTTLLAAFAAGQPFVYILVDEVPDPGALPR